MPHHHECGHRSVSAQAEVSGKRYKLSRAEVIARHKKVEPGPIRAHALEIDGVLHPIKEAFARAADIDLLDFNPISRAEYIIDWVLRLAAIDRFPKRAKRCNIINRKVP